VVILAASTGSSLADSHRDTVVVGTNPRSHMLVPQAIAWLKSERPLLTVIMRESVILSVKKWFWR
jgi:hypothetical protein